MYKGKVTPALECFCQHSGDNVKKGSQRKNKLCLALAVRVSLTREWKRDIRFDNALDFDFFGFEKRDEASTVVSGKNFLNDIRVFHL